MRGDAYPNAGYRISSESHFSLLHFIHHSMEDLLKRTEVYVKNFFEKHSNPFLVYHNLYHTLRVVTHVREMAPHCGLSAEETQLVQVASWFHDTGYLLGKVKDHEQTSVELMQEFVKDIVSDAVTIDRITQCILVTRFPSHPASACEQVICDADTYHLGTDYFRKFDALLKYEMMLRNQPVDNWDEGTLQFLKQHQYFTAYCQQLLEPGKVKNIENLEEKIATEGE